MIARSTAEWRMRWVCPDCLERYEKLWLQTHHIDCCTKCGYPWASVGWRTVISREVFIPDPRWWMRWLWCGTYKWEDK